MEKKQEGNAVRVSRGLLACLNSVEFFKQNSAFGFQQVNSGIANSGIEGILPVESLPLRASGSIDRGRTIILIPKFLNSSIIESRNVKHECVSQITCGKQIWISYAISEAYTFFRVK